MLLYIGALTDLRPVVRFAHAHKKFIYVDGLPDSNYFTENQHGFRRASSVKAIRDAMIIQLKRERAFKSWKDGDDHFVIETIGGQTIRYFYNTKDSDIAGKASIQPYLSEVTALYISGFFPKIDYKLPKLSTIIHTPYCDPDDSDNADKLYFDCSRLEKITIVEYQSDDENEEEIGFYIGSCSSCGETTCLYEEFKRPS